MEIVKLKFLFFVTSFLSPPSECLIHLMTSFAMLLRFLFIPPSSRQVTANINHQAIVISIKTSIPVVQRDEYQLALFFVIFCHSFLGHNHHVDTSKFMSAS